MQHLRLLRIGASGTDAIVFQADPGGMCIVSQSRVLALLQFSKSAKAAGRGPNSSGSTVRLRLPGGRIARQGMAGGITGRLARILAAVEREWVGFIVKRPCSNASHARGPRLSTKILVTVECSTGAKSFTMQLIRRQAASARDNEHDIEN